MVVLANWSAMVPGSRCSSGHYGRRSTMADSLLLCLFQEPPSRVLLWSLVLVYEWLLTAPWDLVQFPLRLVLESLCELLLVFPMHGVFLD